MTSQILSFKCKDRRKMSLVMQEFKVSTISCFRKSIDDVMQENEKVNLKEHR